MTNFDLVGLCEGLKENIDSMMKTDAPDQLLDLFEKSSEALLHIYIGKIKGIDLAASEEEDPSVDETQMKVYG